MYIRNLSSVVLVVCAIIWSIKSGCHQTNKRTTSRSGVTAHTSTCIHVLDYLERRLKRQLCSSEPFVAQEGEDKWNTRNHLAVLFVWSIEIHDMFGFCLGCCSLFIYPKIHCPISTPKRSKSKLQTPLPRCCFCFFCFMTLFVLPELPRYTYRCRRWKNLSTN